MKVSSLGETIGWGFFYLLRALERLLPVGCLCALLWPFVVVATAWELLGPRQFLWVFYRLPASLRPRLTASAWAWRIWHRRIHLNMGRLIWLWPDRLHTTRWQKRCRSTGHERLERYRAQGRPVVLAVLHYGPAPVLRYWLRARGLPIAALGTRPSSWGAPYRDTIDHLSDRASGLADVAHVFKLSQLKSLYRFLEAPRVLYMAMDGGEGKQWQVSGEDFSILLAPGALRLAAHSRAAVVPCLIRADGLLRLTIHFCNPVPDEWIADAHQHQAACTYLLGEFMPMLRAEPEQFTARFLSRLRPPVCRTEPAVAELPGTLS
jgi:lauroyl/myristoyl acyltransferase